MNDNPALANSGQSGPEAAPLLSDSNRGSNADQLNNTVDTAGASRASDAQRTGHLKADAQWHPGGRTQSVDAAGLGTWAAAAAHLHNLGLSPIPLVFRHKHPLAHEWTKLSITTRKDFADRFPARGRGNIGIRLGSAGWWPSGDYAIVDVDIDSDELLARADGVLPQTPWVFGRASRPRSHRLYLVRTGGEQRAARPRKWTSHVGLGCLAELRGDGQQTMAPGSVHPDGHAVVWQPEDNDMGQLARGPALVDLQELIDAISALAGQEPDGGPPASGVPAPMPAGPNGLDGGARIGFSTHWAAGMIGQQARRVRRAEPGKRNSTLFLAALNAGSVVEAGLYPRPVAGRALLQAALSCGLPQQEAIGTINSGFKAASQRPVPLTEVGGWGGGGWLASPGVWEGSKPPHPPTPLSSPSPLAPFSTLGGGEGGGGAGGGGGLPGFAAPQAPLPLASFDEIDAQSLEWLWPGVLPLGKLVCLCGEPGLGKSFVVADIAARLSRGDLGEQRITRDGLRGDPAQTLILNAEDDPADTTRPRLEAAGAVLSEVMCVDVRGGARSAEGAERGEGVERVEGAEGAEGAEGVEPKAHQRPPRDEDGHRLPREEQCDPRTAAQPAADNARPSAPSPHSAHSTHSFDLAMSETLDATLAAHPRVRLVVIDPVSAFFPDHRDSHKQTDVRRVLAPLTALAQRRRVTVLLVAHLNKDSTQSDVHRVSGSTALAAACRAVWIVKREREEGRAEGGGADWSRKSGSGGTKDHLPYSSPPAAPDTPDDSTTPRTMTAAKLNLARDTKELRFRVVEGERGARVVWE